MSDTVSNQSNSNVGGDQVARDKITNTQIHGDQHIHFHEKASSQVFTLLRRLEKQIHNNDRDAFDKFIYNLTYFIDHRDTSDVTGLEAKLAKSKLNVKPTDALSKKEAFSMLLLKFKDFSSAQELFAYFLAHINVVFDEKICPQIDNLTGKEIEDIVDKDIIDKLFQEIGQGSDVIVINRVHVRGMIYWLADKCLVRWHSC